MANCNRCGDTYPPGRAALGYRTCLPCGDVAAREYRSANFTVTIPFSKGAYQVVSREDVAHTNPKR